MLIGYVSDERYIALHDVQFEISNETLHIEARSRATGEIFADSPPAPTPSPCKKTVSVPSVRRSTSPPTDHIISACSRTNCSATPGLNA